MYAISRAHTEIYVGAYSSNASTEEELNEMLLAVMILAGKDIVPKEAGNNSTIDDHDGIPHKYWKDTMGSVSKPNN